MPLILENNFTSTAYIIREMSGESPCLIDLAAYGRLIKRLYAQEVVMSIILVKLLILLMDELQRR
jgi:hypothetical protein